MSDKLDTGMTAAEAVRRASEWWDSTGRYLVNTKANEVERGRKVRVASTKLPGLIISGEQVPVEKGGIFRGLPWAMLQRDEQLRVTKAWHHEFVRRPNYDKSEHSAADQDRDKRLLIQ